MYRSKLLRWLGVALATFALFGISTYAAIQSGNNPVIIAEEPKWGGG